MKIVLCLFLLMTSPVAVSGAPVSVTVHGGADVDASVVLSCGELVKELEVSLVDGSGVVDFSLNDHRQCQISAEAAGFWCETVSIHGTDSSAVDLHLMPAGFIEGTVKVPIGSDLPQRVVLNLSRPVASPAERTESLELTCPVAEGRIADCVAPAGRWHLRASASLFAPVFLWDREVPLHEHLDLKELRLSRGGAVLGCVAAEDGPSDPATAQVRIRPVKTPSLEDDLLEKLGSVNEWGCFSFSDLSSGMYELSVSQPGFITAEVGPLRLSPQEHIELSAPIVMKRGARFVVEVIPRDSPQGDSWDIAFSKPGGGDWIDRGTSEGGVWHSDRMAPGPYYVSVLDEELGEVVRKKVELTEDLQLLKLRVPLFAVDGEVVYGDKGLEDASVSFANSQTVKTDRDGRFSATLGREGNWRLHVACDDPPVSRKLYKKIERGEDEERAELKIELPETFLHGQVLDEMGVPIAESIVTALIVGEKESLTTVTSSEDGWFEAHCVPEGQYGLQAEKRIEGHLMTSDMVQQEVREGLTPSPARLVLKRAWRLSGEVLGPQGPVPRAKVKAIVAGPDGKVQGGPLPIARTDMVGRFGLDLPGFSASAEICVEAPGFAFHVERVMNVGGNEAQRVEVSLEQLGGTLILHGGQRTDLVMVNGNGLPLKQLLDWAKLNGGGTVDGTLTVPHMAAGYYRFCSVTLQELMLVCGGGAAPKLDSCDVGHLAPNGTLSLHLPGS